MSVFCSRIYHCLSLCGICHIIWDVSQTLQHTRYIADTGRRLWINIICRRDSCDILCIQAERITQPRAGMQKRQNCGKIHESYPVIVSSQFRKGMAGCGSKRKANRESARIPQAFGLLPESDLLFLTLARRVPRKSKICSAEVVRFQRPTRYQHDGSSLHRERSGKSCRRPSASCERDVH